LRRILLIKPGYTFLKCFPRRRVILLTSRTIWLFGDGPLARPDRFDRGNWPSVYINTIISKPDDPQLPADSIDAALLLKTYHEVAHPIVLLRNLGPSLKPGAKIGIIDRNGNGADHGVSKDVVVREAAQAGYELRDSQDFVKADGMDYFLIFTRKPD